MSDQAVRKITQHVDAALAARDIVADIRRPGSRTRWGRDLRVDHERAQHLAQLGNSRAQFGDLQLGEVVSREAFAADVAGTTAMRRGEYDGIKPPPGHRFRVLELLPQGTSSGNSVPYVIEGGATAAAETADGAAAPEDASATFTDAQAPVKTIATWIRANRAVLTDPNALQTTLDRRLRRAVLRRLESQVVNGDGTGENLLGLLNVSGIGTVSTGSTAYERVMAGVQAVADAGADPGVVLCSWADLPLVVGPEYSAAMTLKPEPLPVIPSVTVPAGTAIVAAFEEAAEIVIRSGVAVRISDSDRDNFTTGRITLLAIVRAALPVPQPSAICEVTLP